MEWQIEKKNVKCRRICIDSNVIYTGTMAKEGSIKINIKETREDARSSELANCTE